MAVFRWPPARTRASGRSGRRLSLALGRQRSSGWHVGFRHCGRRGVDWLVDFLERPPSFLGSPPQDARSATTAPPHDRRAAEDALASFPFLSPPIPDGPDGFSLRHARSHASHAVTPPLSVSRAAPSRHRLPMLFYDTFRAAAARRTKVQRWSASLADYRRARQHSLSRRFILAIISKAEARDCGDARYTWLGLAALLKMRGSISRAALGRVAGHRRWPRLRLLAMMPI